MEAVDCFESAKESPRDAEVVSQDQAAGEGGGGGPSWLGMKGQMMPVRTARLHINLHLHFFFFKRTFVSRVICISIAQSSPPAAASSEDVRTPFRERHTGVRKKPAKIFRHIL